MIMQLVFFITIIVILYASPGDRDSNFHQCMIYNCKCESPAQSDTVWFPNWSCEENCEYHCMHEITAVRISLGYPILKYYGHWPFYRFLGLEEPASVAFSLLNATPHLFHFLNFRNLTSKYFMSRWLWLYSLFAIVAWTFSAVFHSRKTNLTTKIDYISALWFLCLGLWIAFCRVLGTRIPDFLKWCIGIAELVVLVWHTHHMCTRPLDFGRHMHICIAVSVLQTVIWLLWLVFPSISGHDKAIPLRQRSICLLCQLWFSVAAALEVFDFPPFFGTFDAHSLWHLATIPLGYIWYHFWKLDADFLLEIKQK